jgi:hypothetical protein
MRATASSSIPEFTHFRTAEERSRAPSAISEAAGGVFVFTMTVPPTPS